MFQHPGPQMAWLTQVDKAEGKKIKRKIIDIIAFVGSFYEAHFIAFNERKSWICWISKFSKNVNDNLDTDKFNFFTVKWGKRNDVPVSIYWNDELKFFTVKWEKRNDVPVSICILTNKKAQSRGVRLPSYKCLDIFLTHGTDIQDVGWFPSG